MNKKNESKNILITGASRGLGLALARALASQGWQLLIDARGKTGLTAAAAELAQQTTVVAIAGDITDPEHRIALAQAASQLGGLDAVVNNAGILGPSPQPALHAYPLDTLQSVFETNVLAPLAILQTLRGQLRPGARIINISSDAAVSAYEGWGGYGASKAALEQATAVYAVENPEQRVYWVDPGDMKTAMHQAAFPGEDISDRPEPTAAVPGLLMLLEQDLPGGRYQAQQMPTFV